jgi:hypothetical protein
MLALAIFILLVAAVAVLSWTTRNKRLPVRCCNPAPWPPDDITARGTERDMPGRPAVPGDPA